MDLTGRTALVTGGARGIGRAIALALARAGADVAVNYVNDHEAAAEVVELVGDLGRRAIPVRADVGSWDACVDMVDQCSTELGTVDVLVNNAGVGSQSIGYPTITEAPLADLQAMMAVNLWGAVHLCKLLALGMRDQPRGDIVMISSGAASNARARMGGYTISKAALEALAHTLAAEEREFGTRVNVIAPGLVETDMGLGAMRHFMGTDDVAQHAAAAPFGHICQPIDIANAVVFLCSEHGRYITNQTLAINGGGQ